MLVVLFECLAASQAEAHVTLDLSQDNVLAVSSFEHSNALTLELASNDDLSIEKLSLARADLICKSLEHLHSVSHTRRESFEAGDYTVYESTEPHIEKLPVLNLIEFINPITKEVISFAEKGRRGKVALQFKRYHSKKAIPHLLFDTIVCATPDDL